MWVCKSISGIYVHVYAENYPFWSEKCCSWIYPMLYTWLQGFLKY